MTEPTKEDLIQLTCWLSGIVTQQADCRHDAIALSPEERKEHLMMKFPIVQGYRLQQQLRELGSRPTDVEALRRAMSALRSTLQPSTPELTIADGEPPCPKCGSDNTTGFVHIRGWSCRCYDCESNFENDHLEVEGDRS